MNILISGGSGYIGCFVVKQLLDAGHNVGVIYRNENDFISEYKNRLHLYKADITLPYDFTADTNYDVFIHLAAANDIDSADPSYALKASTLGTRYALDFCKKNDIKKFIYFSTFQVYGRLEANMDEQSTLLPGNDYGITHQFAEQYVEMYQRTSGIDYIILRPTNVYGAPFSASTDRWSLVPSCFCKEALEKGEINILSSGKQSRDFIDVNDVAAITKIYCEDFEDFKNTKVNLCSAMNFTIGEVALMVVDVFQSKYQKKCPLNIHSDLPKVENVFNISMDEINKTGFKFNAESSLKLEINKIFDLLKK